MHGGSGILPADGRTVRFTPTPDANDGNTAGGFGYSYRVTDGVLVSANEAAVTITVSAMAETPVAVSNTTGTTEDTAVNLDVVVNDTDGDTANSVLRVAAGSIVNVHGGSAVFSGGWPDGALHADPGRQRRQYGRGLRLQLQGHGRHADLRE